MYSSIESKASHLLYFIVKNHPFVDGNKRTSLAVFLILCEKNALLYKETGLGIAFEDIAKSDYSVAEISSRLLSIVVAEKEADPKENEVKEGDEPSVHDFIASADVSELAAACLEQYAEDFQYLADR